MAYETERELLAVQHAMLDERRLLLRLIEAFGLLEEVEGLFIAVVCHLLGVAARLINHPEQPLLRRDTPFVFVKGGQSPPGQVTSTICW